MGCEGSRLWSGAFFYGIGARRREWKRVEATGMEEGRGGAGDGVFRRVGKKFDEVGVEEGVEAARGTAFPDGPGRVASKLLRGPRRDKPPLASPAGPGRASGDGLPNDACLSQTVDAPRPGPPGNALRHGSGWFWLVVVGFGQGVAGGLGRGGEAAPCGMGRNGFRMLLTGSERVLREDWEEGSRWRRGGDGVKGMDDVDGCGVLATVCRVLKQ